MSSLLKLLGALIILLAGALIGLYKAAQYASRPKQIRLFIHGLKQLETEISYGHTMLPEALGRISRLLPGSLADFFQQVSEQLGRSSELTVSDCWRQALEQLWPHTAMKQDEQEIIHRLGVTLGVSDRDDQLKHLALTMGQLQIAESTALEEQKRYGTMWKSLGVLLGVLVIILIF